MRTVRSLRLSTLSLLAVLFLAVAAGSALAAKHAVGRPSIKAAEPPAMWIWYDNAGWHFRGSVGKGKHTFLGYVRARGGMSGVKATKEGLMKSQTLETEGVRFEFELTGKEKGAVEGFDWQQSGDECVTAELQIDGKQQPARVFVGLQSEVPDMFPFLACRN